VPERLDVADDVGVDAGAEEVDLVGEAAGPLDILAERGLQDLDEDPLSVGDALRQKPLSVRTTAQPLEQLVTEKALPGPVRVDVHAADPTFPHGREKAPDGLCGERGGKAPSAASPSTGGGCPSGNTPSGRCHLGDPFRAAFG